jgi:hypothetical protein
MAVLDGLMNALTVDALTVPARLQPLLSYAQGDDGDYATQIEIMPTAGGPAFDTLRATEIGAVHVLDSLLDPQRLNRLDMQHVYDPAVPSPVQVLARLIAHADAAATTGAVGRRIATTIALDVVKTLREKGLARSIGLQLNGKLQAWSKDLSNSRGSDELADWRRGLGALLSDQAALTAALSDRTHLPAVPPGMPIG